MMPVSALGFIRHILFRLGTAWLIVLGLLTFAIGSVTLGMAQIIRGVEIYLILPLLFLALLLGWLSAKSPLPFKLAGPLAVALGGEIIFMRMGGLGDNLLAIGRQVLILLAQIWWSPIRQDWPNIEALFQSLYQFWIDCLTLLSRFGTWLWAALQTSATFDPISTIILWAWVLWLVAWWAGWASERYQRPLLALLPAGTLLSTAFAYTSLETNILLTLLAALLLLLAFKQFDNQINRWQNQNIDYPSDIRLDATLATFLLTVMVLGSAYFISNFSVRRLVDFTQSLVSPFTQPAVVDSLGIRLQPAPTTVFDTVRIGGLPRQHLLGTGPELSNQIIMVVYPQSPPMPSANITSTQAVPRFYWRSLSYDRYLGRGWYSSRTSTQYYPPNTPLPSPSYTQTQVIQQQVAILTQTNGLLYSPGELLVVNRIISMATRSNRDTFATTIVQNNYQLRAKLAPNSPSLLQTAPNFYPEWVSARYLPLPEDLPPRVLSLAFDLTATAETPYDRAKAIEQYLRGFPYTLNLPPPPHNRDIVDYFLFDLQRGYCDYYASAMVILARAAGLPARVAVGYVSNWYDYEAGRYVISAADAHSWPEIYFHNTGWVAFEPTPAISQSQISQAPPPFIEPVMPAQAQSQSQPKAWPWRKIAWTVGLTIISLLLLWPWLDSWRLAQLSPAQTLQILNQRLYAHRHRLSQHPPPSETPLETGLALNRVVQALSHSLGWQQTKALSQSQLPILSHLISHSLYAALPPTPAEQSQALAIWRKVRLRFWLLWGYTIVRKRKQLFQSEKVFPNE